MKINKKVVDFFVVEDRNLPLEHRLFLSSVQVGLVISIIGSLVAFILSLSLITLFISIILSCFLLVIYYFARFKGIIKPFILPIIISAIIGVFSTWLLAGGINGPDILPASLILMFALLMFLLNSGRMFSVCILPVLSLFFYSNISCPKS